MTATALDQTPIPLADIDARIDSTPRGALTLAPGRARATPLSSLVPDLTTEEERPCLAMTASTVAEAQLHCFPENLFWDFDFYLASIHAGARRAASYAGYLKDVTDVTVRLMRLYGQQSTIRFRYVHDFIYGFDWARWVRRDDSPTARVRPFDLGFLEQIEIRGRDILRLIEADDEVYPKLEGTSPRNPFPFSREPEQELDLYRLLVERDAIPVPAWERDATPDASKDFDSLRKDTAERLGLAR